MKLCPLCKLTYPEDRTHCFVDRSELVDLEDTRLGTILAGRYRLDAILGEGGMATVYAARHQLVDRTCAIKIMSPMLARDAVVRERFRREARAAQKLTHPNIIEIFDHGETDDGTSYIVMEQLIGYSLAEIIHQGAMDIARGVSLMIQMARGIARAHDLDVIHRDLKPENIFVCKREDGSELVKLLDFGIARSLHDTRLTGQGELFGTPQYMAPERIATLDAGMPADLYALGIIFFEMVTGELPFQSEDIASFFVKHLKETPPVPSAKNPKVPEALDALILALLAKEPKNRPVDAHRVHQELILLARANGYPIPPDPLLDPSSSSRKSPSTLTPIHDGRWKQKTAILGRMLATAFGEAPPEESQQILQEMSSIVTRVATLRDACFTAQEELEKLSDRWRDVRQRFGFAVDALGVDASKAKQEERALSEQLAARREESAACAERFRREHREIARWEGRSGFTVPYAELTAAYRHAADAMDAWLAAAEQEKLQASRIETTTRAIGDIEFQIQELRNALSKHEQDQLREQDACTKTIVEATKEANELEARLGELETCLCDPLRGRSELSGLFQELNEPAAA